jgi:hypothetical protein
MDEEGKATPLWRMTICGEGQKREIGLGHDEKYAANIFSTEGTWLTQSPQMDVCEGI